MALVPIRIDRTSKPPLGTPLRSDGHWSVQGLVGAWAFNEGGGAAAYDAVGANMATRTNTSNIGGVENFNGDNAYNKIAAPTNALRPLRMSVIVKFMRTGDGSANADALASRDDSASNRSWQLSAVNADVPNTPRLIFFPTVSRAYAPAPIINNRWYVVGGAYNGFESRVYLDGISGTPVSDAGGIAPTNSPMWLGSLDGSQQFFKGFQDIVLFFARALLPVEMASISANPWQIYEPETVWVEVGGGAEAALFAGAIYGQSSASAQLSTAITIASQIVAAGSISGGINTAIRLATSAQGAASASALLATAIRMAASAQGHGASTAYLSTAIALAADILAASSASGALSTAIRFGGVLSGSSTTTAALTNAITMAAQSAGLGSTSGQLAGTVAAALFAGTISGSSSASANLSTAVILAAAAQGNSTAQAALSTALELAAQVNGIGSASGALGADISGLAGSIYGSSEAQATLSTAIHLMGLAAGQCGVAGRLAEPVEILAQLRVMAADPLALTISVRDPLAIRVTVQ